MNEKRGIFDYWKLKREYNTLEIKYNSLLKITSNDCLKKILEKVDEPLEVERLKKENKNLRQQVKTLKEILKEVYLDGTKKTWNKSTNRNKN